MKQVDYLIVGFGFSGLNLAFQCLKNNKKITVIDAQNHKASKVAAAVYNPVVLKRFVPIWKAEYQTNLLQETYQEIQDVLQTKIIEPLDTLRIFVEEQEKQTWLKKRNENKTLNRFLSDQIKPNTYTSLQAKFGFGKIKETGRIISENLFSSFQNYLGENYTHTSFDYNQLKSTQNGWEYKNIQAKQIIFCEGIQLQQNPYFKHLTLVPTKGEILQIETEADLPLAIVKAKIFMMPIGNKNYYVGATYNRKDTTSKPTEEGLQYLEKNLQKFFKGNYKIIHHQAGIRPVTLDRRPLVGQHPEHNNMYVLNGMGTRGTLLAPDMALQLFNFIEYQKPLEKEININRFVS